MLISFNEFKTTTCSHHIDFTLNNPLKWLPRLSQVKQSSQNEYSQLYLILLWAAAAPRAAREQRGRAAGVRRRRQRGRRAGPLCCPIERILHLHEFTILEIISKFWFTIILLAAKLLESLSARRIYRSDASTKHYLLFLYFLTARSLNQSLGCLWFVISTVRLSWQLNLLALRHLRSLWGSPPSAKLRGWPLQWRVASRNITESRR